MSSEWTRGSGWNEEWRRGEVEAQDLECWRPSPVEWLRAAGPCGKKNPRIFIYRQQTCRFQRQILLQARTEERIRKGLDFLCEWVALGTSKICVFVSVIFKLLVMFGGHFRYIYLYIYLLVLPCTFPNAETMSFYHGWEYLTESMVWRMIASSSQTIRFVKTWNN